MVRRRISALSTALRVAAVLTALGVAGAPALSDVAHAQQSSGPFQVMPVRGNVFMISGAGGHVTLSAGVDGLLVVDTGSVEMADQLLATITDVGKMVWASPTRMTTCVGPTCYGAGSTGSFTPYGYASPAYNAIVASPAPLKPLRWIIQTSVDPDHVGGTPTLAAAGRSYAGGNLTTILGDSGASEGSIVMAHEKVLLRMTESNYPEGAWAFDTYYTPTHRMNYVNGEGVQLYYAPNAITDGDTFVHFKYSDVISAGDLYTSDRYPKINIAKGGTIQGVIDGLNQILDVAYPEFRHQGGTMVIPGHGRIGDSADVATYRNMVSIVRDRIQELIEEGKSLQEIKAATPTLDYDGVYGSPDEFIEAVHQNLTAAGGTGSR